MQNALQAKVQDNTTPRLRTDDQRLYSMKLALVGSGGPYDRF
jgi:hypothetical protein